MGCAEHANNDSRDERQEQANPLDPHYRPLF
jgi:hypothetical protein